MAAAVSKELLGQEVSARPDGPTWPRCEFESCAQSPPAELLLICLQLEDNGEIMPL